MPESHSSAPAAERITPIWCHVFGREWQKACTALSGLGEKRSFETNSTPDVPSETKAELGVTVPTPQAEAGLSPPPPAITGSTSIFQRLASTDRSFPVTSVPS